MKLILKYKAYILGVYAFLLLIHFTIKDNIFPVSIFFYATPIVLIIGFGFFILWLYSKNKIILLLLIIIQSSLVYYWLSKQYYVEAINIDSEAGKSVLFWNIGKNKNGFPFKTIAEKTSSEDIGILAFVETDSITSIEHINVKAHYKLYTFKKLKGNMLIGVKGTIESVLYKAKKKRFKFNHIISEIDNIKTSILIVDVYASPFYSKEKTLNSIITYANTNAIDIIVGDFNTPYESVHFKNFNKTYTSFHSYGDGFTATWPYGIPLLELDQIWIKKETTNPITLKKSQSQFSDHKLLIAEYHKY